MTDDRRRGADHSRRQLDRLRLVVIGAVLVSSGCARRAETPFARARPDEPVRVEVDNGNFLDVTVYFMPDGAWQRLGQVTGASSSTLEVPTALFPATGHLRLMVNPIGSREAYMSEDILVMPGDVVQLRVGSVLSMSSWSVLRE